MRKRARQLTVAVALSCSIGAALAPAGYADTGGLSEEHRRRPARPDAPPSRPPGLFQREDNETIPDRPPQANNPITGPAS